MVDDANLDADAPITRLQSAAVRNALLGLIASILTLVTAATGKVFDISAINDVVNNGWPIIVFALTSWTSWRSYVGRVNATKVIKK